MGWLDGWNSRKYFVQNNNSARDLEDYSFYYTLEYLVGRMQEDFGDIRATEADGTTILPIQVLLEEVGPVGSVKLMITTGNVPRNVWLGWTNRLFYIYYNTVDELTQAEICASEEYDLCDDFNDEIIDDEWVVTVENTGVVTEEPEGYLRILNGVGNQTNKVYGTTEFGPGVEFSCRIKFETPVSDPNYTAIEIGFRNPGTGDDFLGFVLSQGTFKAKAKIVDDFTEVNITEGFSYDKWMHLNVIWYADGTSDFYLNGVFITNITDTLVEHVDLRVCVWQNNWIFSRVWGDNIDYVTVHAIAREDGDDPEIVITGDEEAFSTGDTSVTNMIDDIVFRLKDRVKDII